MRTASWVRAQLDVVSFTWNRESLCMQPAGEDVFYTCGSPSADQRNFRRGCARRDFTLWLMEYCTFISLLGARQGRHRQLHNFLTAQFSSIYVFSLGLCKYSASRCIIYAILRIVWPSTAHRKSVCNCPVASVLHLYFCMRFIPQYIILKCFSI